jgi:uncharacterized protein YjiS (DUF1127 family)
MRAVQHAYCVAQIGAALGPTSEFRPEQPIEKQEMKMSSLNTLANSRVGAMAFALECLGNAVFGTATRALREKNDRRILEQELSRLSERELLDIGLSPGDARRAFWDERHPVDMTLRRP